MTSIHRERRCVLLINKPDSTAESHRQCCHRVDLTLFQPLWVNWGQVESGLPHTLKTLQGK